MAPCPRLRARAAAGPLWWLLPTSLLRLAVGAKQGLELFDAPADLRGQPAWLAGLRRWRSAVRREINFTGQVYLDPAVNWTRFSYVQPQTHLYDRYLYDPDEGEYTVDRYLADVEARYGGIDSILLWPTYTNIGIDARNQFDYFRALPGGLQGLKDLTASFKSRGVRVLLAYSPWDHGTRDEGVPDWVALARLIRETGADGFNGDTMVTMYRQFWDAGVQAGHRIVGEMEGGGYPNLTSKEPADRSWASANWSPMGWGSFNQGAKEKDNITYAYPVAPGVDKAKWLDGRRMTHVCDRWAKNRTSPLQYVFFNGIGFESWENVWGIFMHMTPRDGEAVRRVATLLRWFGRERLVQDFEDWEPYTPDLRREPLRPFANGGLMASRFIRRGGGCLWLIVNRGGAEEEAELASSRDRRCGGPGRATYDLYRGARLSPLAAPHGGADEVVRVRVEAHGFGAVLATSPQELAVSSLEPLLQRMRDLTRKPLEAFSASWRPLPQAMVRLGAAAGPVSTAPPGMVLIPRAVYRFRTAGVEIEGGCDVARDTFGVCCRTATRRCPQDEACANPCANAGEDSRGVDVQFPWEREPGRFHERVLDLGPFFIDRHLVTKGDFAHFLYQSAYAPRDAWHFLVGWRRLDGAWAPPAGEERQPVVSVSLKEARQYCAWAGKRLPHSYEWQLAAQGTDGRPFPWGGGPLEGAMAAGRLPRNSRGRSVPALPDVGTYSPAGDSPYGVADLVGFVWQYTDEFRDDHTRTVLLKGCSLYTPMISSDFPAMQQSSNWYFPMAPQVDRHNRMMLMDDSYERAATLGFRCVADHAEGAPAPHHFRDLGPHGEADQITVLTM